MKSKLLSVIFACTFVLCANAQSFSRHSIGIDGGTYGFGVWGATNLSNNFVLRAGFSYFGLNTSVELTTLMDGYVVGTNEQVRDVNTIFGQPKIRVPHGRLIVEWYPVADGIFSFAFGTYIGTFDIVANGLVENYENLVAQHGGDIIFETMRQQLHPRSDGSFDGRIRLGNAVKPYVGIGIGRSIPKSGLGFKLDLGIAYQGNVRFISEQASVDDVRDAVSSQDVPADLGMITTLTNLARFWPVLNLSLSYRF